jgi:hypothetical protein
MVASSDYRRLMPIHPTTTMKTSSFLTSLRTHPGLPLVFRADQKTVSPGYHLTEVKRVSYETMDCGAMAHRWSESQFEIWVPSRADSTPGRGHMPAEKFLRIVERVEAELHLQGDSIARIHASFEGQPASLYDIEEIVVRDGALWAGLSPDRTRCKAAERSGAGVSGKCCGAASAAPEKAEAGASCGCGAVKSESAATMACCT